ncbi:hypothetical protein [Oceanihabitans sediminis]|uniref:hypothetical protein n=1 Tax=Oceanihabitans sediminis TaxID=1812012 RepID=UPI00092FEBC6|nr:hypothetical protein [Oceanihabitans sediminis]MDX1774832.1 hypothetical protein [Oceanihabitans sediminis]
MKRICIYPSDVVYLLGKSQNASQTLLRTIKDAFEKEKHQVVTIKEFCDYMGLPFEEVFNMINSIKRGEESA